MTAAIPGQTFFLNPKIGQLRLKHMVQAQSEWKLCLFIMTYILNGPLDLKLIYVQHFRLNSSFKI